jgi:CPA2 family monovalent cation:H+ antiporter-2
MAKGTIQIGTRAVFALIIVLVALSETLGAENILGAFLAGVLVSLLSPNQELVHKLDSFGYGFLIPIFFVMVGVNLDLRSLFAEPKILWLIPLLFIALVISKIVPVYIMRIWYDKKTALASGFLLVSTLSLVIAAATIAQRMNMIGEEMKGALILVAVLTSIISPILFKKLYPKHSEDEHKLKVHFIGANQFTLPVTRELNEKRYEVTLYHTKQEKIELPIVQPVFPIVEVNDYALETLNREQVFTADILIVSTGDEQLNAEIATFAKEQGIERVIALVGTPELDEKLRAMNIDVISVLFSTKALLKALIESPSVVNILTNQESTLYQIEMNNLQYDGVMLRHFPFIGDCIIVRIFRGKDSIVPHGDTELQIGDRLVVTGSREYVDELRRVLEFCEY